MVAGDCSVAPAGGAGPTRAAPTASSPRDTSKRHGRSVRVAGGLVLLFGQPLTRIAQLTAGAISHRGDQVGLTLADHPVLLPPALAHLVPQLADQPQLVSALPPSPGASRWLFPGRPAGQPLTASTLGRWLNAHGIHARPARSTALLQLAGDLPAAVFAELLGLHINTVVGWSGYARRDWAAYLDTADPNTACAPTQREVARTGGHA